MRTGSLFLLALPLAWASHSAPARATGPDLWEAWYSVSASVRTARLDADLEAGGRLAMAGLPGASGGLVLSLSAALEHPWKLYWVDPLGPLGDELKVASVVTLPEASWQALAAAESASTIAGAARHSRWLGTTKRRRELDGSFAFVVIGAARNRFGIEISPGGTVSKITNHLTDRWLSGPFDRFVGDWGNESRSAAETAPAPAPEGYWFWNHGEGEPFDYEPHTYHAFAAALELLSLPLPPVHPPKPANEETIVWDHLGRRAAGVLSILAPKIDSDALRTRHSVESRVLVAREELPTGNRRLTMTALATASLPHAERQTVFSSEGRPVSDRIRVRLTASNGESLEIEAGYRPLDSKEESK